MRRPAFLASGMHTECSEPETVVELTARVVAEPKALVEFRAWEAQSLRLSQNWRLIAAREAAVEITVGVIAERLRLCAPPFTKRAGRLRLCAPP